VATDLGLVALSSRKMRSGKRFRDLCLGQPVSLDLSGVVGRRQTCGLAETGEHIDVDR